MNNCPNCHEFLYETFTHKCLPYFMVWDAEHDESDAYKVFAADEQSAAEKWAEDDDCNSADYSIVGGDEAEVFVKSPDGTITKFQVSGEATPQYYAREIK